MFCRNCGAQGPDGAAFCRKCGAPLNEAPVADPAPEIMQPKRSAKKRNCIIGIAAGAVAVVLVVVLAISFLGGRDYESVVEDYIKATFEADGKTMMSLYPDGVIEVLCEHADMTERELVEACTKNLEIAKEHLDRNYDEWSYSYEITAVEDFSKEELKAIKETYEDEFDVTVKEAKTVTIELTFTKDGDDEPSDSGDFTLIKVGNSWYLDIVYNLARSGITYDDLLTQFRSDICGSNTDPFLDGPISAPSPDGADPIEVYMEAADKTTATGCWTETMDLTADMVLEDGSSTTKVKTTMDAAVDIEGWNGADTSELYMSGSASMSVMNQELAYSLTWKDGVAHYEYTKPTVTTADVEIDPSYFNFTSLTEVNTASYMDGNHITILIHGDDLTSIGISAVNSLMSGIENLSYGDATVDVFLNAESGKIDTLTMTFHASMTYQGFDVETDYEIHYAFSDYAP